MSLSREFQARLWRQLEPNCKVFAVSVCKLFLVQKREWKDVGIFGAVVYLQLASTVQQLRIYDLDTLHLRFQCELSYDPMFCVETEHFHTLELEKLQVGLLHSLGSKGNEMCASQSKSFASAIRKFKLSAEDLKLAKKRKWLANAPQTVIPSSSPAIVYADSDMEFCPATWRAMIKEERMNSLAFLKLSGSVLSVQQHQQRLIVCPAQQQQEQETKQAVCKHSFIAKEKPQITVLEGQRVRVLNVYVDGWTRLEVDARVGLVPTLYLEFLTPVNEPPPVVPPRRRVSDPPPPMISSPVARVKRATSTVARPAPVAPRQAPAPPLPFPIKVARPAPPPPVKAAPQAAMARPAPPSPLLSRRHAPQPVVEAERVIAVVHVRRSAPPPPTIVTSPAMEEEPVKCLHAPRFSTLVSSNNDDKPAPATAESSKRLFAGEDNEEPNKRPPTAPLPTDSPLELSPRAAPASLMASILAGASLRPAPASSPIATASSSKPSFLDAIVNKPRLRSASERTLAPPPAQLEKESSLANVFSKAMDNIRGAMHGDSDDDDDRSNDDDENKSDNEDWD